MSDPKPEKTPPEKVIDLMDALLASLEKAKADRVSRYPEEQ